MGLVTAVCSSRRRETSDGGKLLKPRRRRRKTGAEVESVVRGLSIWGFERRKEEMTAATLTAVPAASKGGEGEILRGEGQRGSEKKKTNGQSEREM